MRSISTPACLASSRTPTVPVTVSPINPALVRAAAIIQQNPIHVELAGQDDGFRLAQVKLPQQSIYRNPIVHSNSLEPATFHRSEGLIGTWLSIPLDDNFFIDGT